LGASEVELFLFARLHARTGNAKAVQKAIHDVQGPTRAEAGCLDYHAFQSVKDIHEFYIHSRWMNQAAFDSHVAQPHTRSFVDRVQPLIDAPLKPVLTQRLA
jgi:quinol monooxygenase YgiN